MFGVGRGVNVGADVHAGTGSFLQRDHRQAIQEVVQDLLALLRKLRGDAIAQLRRRRQDAAVVLDLRESTQTTESGGGGKRLQVAVVDFAGEAGGTQRVKTHVLVQFKREAVRADG